MTSTLTTDTTSRPRWRTHWENCRSAPLVDGGRGVANTRAVALGKARKFKQMCPSVTPEVPQAALDSSGVFVLFSRVPNMTIS